MASDCIKIRSYRQKRKFTSYKEFIAKEPVQFTGPKLFYKNDFREPHSRMLTPEEVLRLKPQPILYTVSNF